MKIATWNVERLKHRKSLNEIIDICNSIQADILALTENDDAIKPDYKYWCHTPTPPPFKRKGHESITYSPSEHRVSIYTNYEIKCQHETYDKYTALCLELETENGNILVYGTIMGIQGNRHSSFKRDLIKQTEDFNKLSEEGYNLCICGDYNCSFSDNYYFTHK
ncbi:endonuclease/exonuclease/phosphatase family protein [uncultured Methanobrevibacter sp.]|uniref:endonuclease/exonuclease/phosphatase family protein n=1 Tax=uncultured Methanobrevibacter sp. TaxID=253161 RepID=UPI00345992E1